MGQNISRSRSASDCGGRGGAGNRMAWEERYRTVASTSQSAIRRCMNLADGTQDTSVDRPRVLEAVGEWRELMWVKEHSGVDGADRMAKTATLVGDMMLKPCIATPAGIKQAYPVSTKALNTPSVIVTHSGAHVHPHRQKTHESVATSHRKSPRSTVPMRGDTERSPCPDLQLRGGNETEVGRHLDGPGVLHGSYNSLIVAVRGKRLHIYQVFRGAVTAQRLDDPAEPPLRDACPRHIP